MDKEVRDVMAAFKKAVSSDGEQGHVLERFVCQDKHVSCRDLKVVGIY